MKRSMKKFMAMLLAVVMVVGSFSTVVSAIDDTVACNHEFVPYTDDGSDPVVAPTCEEEGYTWGKCTKCDHEASYNHQPALGHKLGEATCDKDGLEYQYCVNASCDYREATGEEAKHNMVAWSPNSSVVCGDYVGEKCTVCDYLDNHDFARHEYKMVAVITEPTCDTQGTVRFECTVCGEFRNVPVATLSPTGTHTWVETAHEDATCTEAGYTSYACSVCGAEKTDVIGKLGHDLSTTVEKCVSTTVCSRCDYLVVDEHAHTAKHVSVHKYHTCEQYGFVYEYCLDCGWSSDLIPVEPGHVWVEQTQTIVKEPTCTEPGSIVTVTGYVCNHASCELCGGHYAGCGATTETTTTTEVIPATGHNHVLNTTLSIAPTCAADGLNVWECTECDDVIYEKVDATPDVHGEEGYHVLQAPTCTTPGTGYFFCNTCHAVDDAITYEEALNSPEGSSHRAFAAKLAPLDHKYADGSSAEVVVDVVAPTCAEGGYTTWECQLCFVTEDRDFVDAINAGILIELGDTTNAGHTGNLTLITNPYGDWERLPSCVAHGLKKFVCEDCGTYVLKVEDSILEHEMGPAVEYIPQVDATCTTTGKTAVYIQRCTNEIEILDWDDEGVTAVIRTIPCTHFVTTGGETIAMKPHTRVTTKEAVASTCTEAGHTAEISCGDCGKILSASRELALAPHQYEITVEAVASTCVVAGHTAEKVCSVCGDTIASETLPLAAHKYSVTKAAQVATCTEDGWTKEETCGVCGAVRGGTTLAALGHAEVSYDYKAPSCTEDGHMPYTQCTRCGEVTVGAHQGGVPTLPSLGGHNMVYNDVVEPTCTEYGYVYDHCTNCARGDLETFYVHELIAPIGHDYEEVIIEADCTTPYWKGEVCANCGDKITHEEGPALGHDVPDHTTTTIETLTVACGRCGVQVDAHDGMVTTTENQVTYTCVMDGENAICRKTSYVEHVCSGCALRIMETLSVEDVAHNYIEADRVEPTRENAGKIVYACTQCQHTYEEELPWVGSLEFVYTVDAFNPDPNAPAKFDDGFANEFLMVNGGYMAVRVSMNSNGVALWGNEMVINYNANRLVFDAALSAQESAGNGFENTFYADGGKVKVASVVSNEDGVMVNKEILGENIAYVTLVFRIKCDSYIRGDVVNVGFSVDEAACLINDKDNNEIVAGVTYGMIDNADIHMSGDMDNDGRITNKDAQMIMNLIVTNGVYTTIADMDGDGYIRSNDFSIIRAIIAEEGLTDSYAAYIEANKYVA